MADYDIASNFPNGLLLNALIQEMPDVWPADVFPADYSAPGNPNRQRTNGTLSIRTARELTSEENDDALAHFQTHNASNVAPVGYSVATLPAPSDFAGSLVYCNDTRRAQGSERGAMVYSDGTQWLRVADDREPRP